MFSPSRPVSPTCGHRLQRYTDRFLKKIKKKKKKRKKRGAVKKSIGRQKRKIPDERLRSERKRGRGYERDEEEEGGVRTRFPNPRANSSHGSRESAVSLARVGGPANNAGLVFLNSRRLIGVSFSLSLSLLWPGPVRLDPTFIQSGTSERNTPGQFWPPQTSGGSGSRVSFSLCFFFTSYLSNEQKHARKRSHGPPSRSPITVDERKRGEEESAEWIIEVSETGRSTAKEKKKGEIF